MGGTAAPDARVRGGLASEVEAKAKVCAAVAAAESGSRVRYALQKYRTSINRDTNFSRRKNGICNADVAKKQDLPCMIAISTSTILLHRIFEAGLDPDEMISGDKVKTGSNKGKASGDGAKTKITGRPQSASIRPQSAAKVRASQGFNQVEQPAEISGNKSSKGGKVVATGGPTSRPQSAPPSRHKKTETSTGAGVVGLSDHHAGLKGAAKGQHAGRSGASASSSKRPSGAAGAGAPVDGGAHQKDNKHDGQQERRSRPQSHEKTTANTTTSSKGSMNKEQTSKQGHQEPRKNKGPATTTSEDQHDEQGAPSTGGGASNFLCSSTSTTSNQGKKTSKTQPQSIVPALRLPEATGIPLMGIAKNQGVALSCEKASYAYCTHALQILF